MVATVAAGLLVAYRARSSEATTRWALSARSSWTSSAPSTAKRCSQSAASRSRRPAEASWAVPARQDLLASAPAAHGTTSARPCRCVRRILSRTNATEGQRIRGGLLRLSGRNCPAASTSKQCKPRTATPEAADRRFQRDHTLVSRSRRRAGAENTARKFPPASYIRRRSAAALSQLSRALTRELRKGCRPTGASRSARQLESRYRQSPAQQEAAGCCRNETAFKPHLRLASARLVSSCCPFLAGCR